MPVRRPGRARGFSLVEMLVAVGIIAVLAAIVIVATGPARRKARDAKRKFELNQIGRFLAAGSCYEPQGGPGEYDLADLFTEVQAKYPQVKAMVSKVPRDPSQGSDAETFYLYIYQVKDGQKACALYANLESETEPVTIQGISQPTAGRGSGVLQAATPGWNGSDRYFQVSN